MNRRGQRVAAALLKALAAACSLACLCGAIALSACDGMTPGGNGAPTGAGFQQPSEVATPLVLPDAGSEPTIYVDQAASGYVIAKAASDSRLKFQVTNGVQTYNYDLSNQGVQEVYPINMGDGAYTFRIMQNTSGNNYVELCSASASVALDSEFAPFLAPNLYCDYDASSACVGKARDLTSQSGNVGQVVQAVCEYVAGNIRYDNAKAEELADEAGYIPNPDKTLEDGTGVCFDYASLASAMLRSMGIPTKIVTGYVGEDSIYHAWIMVYIDGSWQSAQFRVDPNTWSRCDVTFAATGATQYVGDASAYTDRYTY